MISSGLTNFGLVSSLNSVLANAVNGILPELTSLPVLFNQASNVFPSVYNISLRPTPVL
jgi:hypothetical protein